MEKSNEIIQRTKKQMVAIIIPIILVILLNYGICNISMLLINAIPLCVSIFMMYIIVAFLTAITKKMHRAVYIVSILIFIISVVNNVKLCYTNSPIYLSDIYFVNNINEITGIVKKDIFLYINYIQLILLLILLVITSWISKKFSLEITHKKARITTGILAIIVSVLFLAPIQAKEEFFLNTIYEIEDRKDYDAITTGKEYYSKYGFISGMYGLYLEEKLDKPEGYNVEEIKNVVYEYSDSLKKDKALKSNKKVNGNPNIIVMFQESYWDIENIEEVEFNVNITENINDLKEEGQYVKLLTPSYGGLSSNVEFELLTGGNLLYFNTGYNPFLQLYRKKTAENNPSIIKELKNNGYNTSVVFGVDYYLSESVYKKIGIDEYENIYIDRNDWYNANKKGIYVSDEALVDNVLEKLKNKEREEKIFFMTATIQSHMPFTKEKYENYDIEVTKSSLSEDENDVILSYAQGVYDTNIQIQRLYKEIQNIEEPTVIVILGDHLPYLYNSEGEDILQKLSYFNTGDEKLDLLRKYTTDALILSNYEMNLEIESEYMSPDLLLTTIINNLNLEISPFYEWLYQTKDILPAQNQYLIIDKESNIYYKNETITQEIDEIKQLKEKIQYYYFKEENK